MEPKFRTSQIKVFDCLDNMEFEPGFIRFRVVTPSRKSLLAFASLGTVYPGGRESLESVENAISDAIGESIVSMAYAV